MYIYGIYPSGNSDVIPLAISSTLLFSHVYVSNEPVTRLVTRMEYKVPYPRALRILQEVSPIVSKEIQVEPSQFVYFAVAINPMFKQANQIANRDLQLNGRTLKIRSIPLGVLAECEKDSVYDTEYSIIIGNPMFYINGEQRNPCSICHHNDLLGNKRYCVYYVRGHQCLFMDTPDLQITTEGLAEALYPQPVEIPENLLNADSNAEAYGEEPVNSWEVEL